MVRGVLRQVVGACGKTLKLSSPVVAKFFSDASFVRETGLFYGQVVAESRLLRKNPPFPGQVFFVSIFL